MSDEKTKEIIKLKGNLRRNWEVIRDDKLPITDRKAAYENIENLSEKIKELEPSFEIIDMKNTKYYDLIRGKKPNENNSTGGVNWPTLNGNEYEEEANQLERIISRAVVIAKKRHPKLADDTDKFGQIVNAIVTHLIALTR